MKKSLRLVFAAMATVLLAASCEKEVEETAFSSDPESLLEVPCKDPADQVLALKTNVNWIVITPKWVKATPIFGSGDTMVSFAVESNYINEKTDVDGRSGEIVFSGGGKSYTVLISQLGYTAPYDPSASIGGIPDESEFLKFVESVNANDGTTRWQNDSKEVELLADLDLSSYTEWTPIGNPESVTNGNNASSYTGNAFKGIFNGGNHTIKGFNPTAKVAENGTFGLFGVLDGATVKDLTIETDMHVSADAQADAGVLAGTAISSTIQNVTIKGKLTSTGTATDNKRYSVGGLVGFAFSTSGANGTISNCTVDLAATAQSGSNTKNGATGGMYGGIAGFITNPKDDSHVTVENCTNNGTITASVGRSSGICATSNCGGVFKSCTNNADHVNTFVNGRISNVVALLSLSSSLENCVNNGDLTTTDATTTTGAIVALFNDASVTLKGGKNTGKIIGANSKYLGLLGANLSKFTSIDDYTVSGSLGIYSADGNHEMIDVNAGNFEQYIGSVSDASRALITNLHFEGSSAPDTPTVEGIGSAADLMEFASLYNAGGDYSKFVVDGAIVLGADIDLGGETWPVIGTGTVTTAGAVTEGTPFTAIFDGKGHTVDNFKVSLASGATSGTAAGLFGVISGGTVRNVNVGSKAVIEGGVAGFVVNGTVEGCNNYGTVSLTAVTDNVREAAGGIVGQVYTLETEGSASYIKDCNNFGRVTSTNTVNTKNGATGLSVGGIAGFTDGKNLTYVQNCTNKADITAQATRLGGIVASANTYTKIEDCTNEGNLSDSDVTASNSRVGGISSAASTSVTFLRCVNKGNVTFSVAGDSTHGYAAGILGQANNPITIESCENYGTITTDMVKASEKYVGAIIGNPNSKVVTVTKCKVGGKVGPVTEDADNKVTTLTKDNFETYITLSSKKGSCVFSDNVCGN